MPKSIEKNKKLLSILILTIVFGMGIFISTFALTDYAFADSTTNSRSTGASKVSLTLAPIITLRILDSTASSEITSLPIDITPTPNGAFAKNSLIVEGATSNPTGYKLYMNSIGTNPVSSNGSIDGGNSGNSGTGGSTSSNTTYTTDLVNIDSSVPSDIGLIPTLNTNTTITEAEFRVRNSNYRNRWGYSLNGLTISSNTDSSTGEVTNTITENTGTSTISYHDIPANSEQRMIDEKETESDKGLTPITIGVNATSGLASGTYKNTLEFTAIANEIPIDYKLTFNGNSDGSGGESGVTNIPAAMTASTLASSYTFTIPQTEPLLTKKGIIGWSTSPDSRAGNGSGPDGLYVYGDTFTINADDTDPYSTEKTLYAIWGDFFTVTYMQEMSSTICNTVYTPSNVTSTNARAIVLRADTTSSVDGAGGTSFVNDMAGYDAIVSSNNQPYVAQRTLSDIRDSKKYIIRKMADGNCWMSENLKFELQAGKTYTGVNNTTGNTITFNTGAVCGNGNTNAACIMNGNTAYGSTYNTWYYSWYAATAGSGTSSMTTDSGDATNSICPAHWRLPTNYTNTSYPSGGAPKSWGYLVNSYGISPENHGSTSDYKTLEAFPFTLPRAGYFSSGAFKNSGNVHWWSSTARSTATDAYNLSFDTTGVNPQGYNNKYHGFNIRCVSI